jgi:excisionase family DNA binding protein
MHHAQPPPPKVCPRDGYPLTDHMRCRSCNFLVGSRHPEQKLYDGRCSRCVRADEWLSTGQAARLVGVSGKTIRRLIRIGSLTPALFAPRGDSPQGRRYRLLRADVEHLMWRRDGSLRVTQGDSGSPPVTVGSPPQDS